MIDMTSHVKKNRGEMQSDEIISTTRISVDVRHLLDGVQSSPVQSWLSNCR